MPSLCDSQVSQPPFTFNKLHHTHFKQRAQISAATSADALMAHEFEHIRAYFSSRTYTNVCTAMGLTVPFRSAPLIGRVTVAITPTHGQGLLYRLQIRRA